MKQKYKQQVLLGLSFILLGLGIALGYVALRTLIIDMNAYRLSSQCVSEYVQLGIPRNRIQVEGSTCYLREAK